MTAQPSPIEAARAGDAVQLGQLLEPYRDYLCLLARVQIGQRLQRKVDESDLVQETFLEAHRAFTGFQGATQAQLAQWLRTILARKLADLLRRFLGAQGRDVRLELELSQAVDRSTMVLEKVLAGSQTSPSQQAVKHEEAVLLAAALARLPEDYREAVVLRNLEGLPFAQVAQRMGRSVDSVEKLWLRGLAQLKREMAER